MSPLKICRRKLMSIVRAYKYTIDNIKIETIVIITLYDLFLFPAVVLIGQYLP